MPPTNQQDANSAYADIAALVLVSWELLVHGFQDLSYLRRFKTLWKRPVLWAYFIQRYGAFAVILSQSLIRLDNHINCHATGLVALVVGGVFVLPSISLIYLYRVLAIWERRPIIKWILSVSWVIVLGASLTAPFAQEAANGPNGECMVIRNEKYTPASFIVNVVYDGVIFVLTVVKLGYNRKQYSHFKSPLQVILLRDGLLYFAVSVVIGVIDIAFLEAIPQPGVATLVLPIHIALASVMTTRLVNNVFRVLQADVIQVDSRLNFDAQDGYGGTNDPAMSTMRFDQRKLNETATSGTVMIVGSGVGTDYFEEIGQREVGSEVTLAKPARSTTSEAHSPRKSPV